MNHIHSLPVRRVLALAAMLGFAALGSACHTTRLEPSRPVRAPMKVVQLFHGAEARYAVCVEPACPVPTPKTVGAPAASPAASAAAAKE